MIARLSALRRWLAEECRLLGLDSWAGGAYDGPQPCTAADPRCQRTIERLAECRARMRAESILNAMRRKNAPPVRLVTRKRGAK